MSEYGGDVRYGSGGGIYSLEVRRLSKQQTSASDPWANSPVAKPANLVGRANVVEITLPTGEPGWLKSVIEQIVALEDLDANWDGYGAARVTREAIVRALNYVDAVARRGIVAPSVVPLTRGAVQLEWRGPTGDLEVVLPSEGPAMIFRENVDDEEQLMDDARAGDITVSWLTEPRLQQRA